MEIFSYLFSPIPGSTFNYYTYLLIFGIALIIIGILFLVTIKIKKENKAFKKTYKTTPSKFIWIGIIVIILTASRTNGIPYLSMRLLLFIAVGLAVYYIFMVIINYFKKYPEYKKVVAPKKNVQKETHKYTTSKK